MLLGKVVPIDCVPRGDILEQLSLAELVALGTLWENEERAFARRETELVGEWTALRFVVSLSRTNAGSLTGEPGPTEIQLRQTSRNCSLSPTT